MPETADPQSTGAQVEALLSELSQAADPRVAQRAEELVRLLTQLYGAGLERVMSIVEAEFGNDALERFTSDELVASLLVLHDLHPKDTATRVQEALDRVRPYLGSHAGGVEFVDIDDEGVLHLQLEGNCDGCPSSTQTVKYAIEGAIEETAPEIARVDVQGMTDGTAHDEHPQSATTSNVIPVGALFRECPVPETEARA